MLGLESLEEYYSLQQWRGWSPKVQKGRPCDLVSITKPLRVFSCAYHQYLLLKLIDPDSDRSCTPDCLPRCPEEVAQLKKDLTSRDQGHRQAKEQASHDVTQVLYQFIPEFEVYRNALVVSKAPNKGGKPKKIGVRLLGDLDPDKVHTVEWNEQNGAPSLDTLITALVSKDNVVHLENIPLSEYQYQYLSAKAASGVPPPISARPMRCKPRGELKTRHQIRTEESAGYVPSEPQGDVLDEYGQWVPRTRVPYVTPPIEDVKKKGSKRCVMQ